ncbi:MAG: TetR/AcrR family transcriptional regulator [Verrucomicrobiota bacterium]
MPMQGRPKNFEPEVVLRQALEVFWTKGYEATSLTDLLGAMGLGRQSFYSEFGSKRELFLLAVRNYAENETAAMISLIRGGETALEGIRSFFEEAMQAHFSQARRGCFLTNSIAILSKSDGDFRECLESCVGGLREAFVERVEEGIESGEFAQDIDSEAMGMLFFVIGQGLSVAGKCVQSRKQVEASVKELLKLLR